MGILHRLSAFLDRLFERHRSFQFVFHNCTEDDLAHLHGMECQYIIYKKEEGGYVQGLIAFKTAYTHINAIRALGTDRVFHASEADKERFEKDYTYARKVGSVPRSKFILFI